MKNFKWSYLGSFVLFLMALVCGVTQGVCMADTVIADLPDAGKTVSRNEGGLTETVGREAIPEMYLSDIDKRITRIRPMATPIDQISRYGKAIECDSMEVKYYSVGTKPIKTTVKTAFEKQSSGTSTTLEVTDASMFDESDTIRVVGIKGYINGEEGQPSTEDLMLHVIGASDSNGQPVVYAVNGLKASDGQPTMLPAIAQDTVLIRLGKACAELDAQTAVFSNIPTPETQYCQNFMMQVEQSTFDKIALKEVDWTFSDLEEDSVYDMRLGQENSFLFGVKGKIKHPRKKNNTWFTEGIWWQAGKDITLGTWDSDKSEAVVSDDELVDLAKDLFTGTGVGNKRKVLFAGSNLLAALSKITSEKFRLKESVEVWNLKFKSFDTDFGEVLVMHHELFDQNGMADYGLAIDPTYLTKKVHINWERNVLDLKSAGIRNTDATVLREVCCLYLRYKKAHARIKLATA